MPQFDVFRNPRGGIYPLVVDVQADLHAKLSTRVVVPLVARARYAAQPLTRLTPVVAVLGDDYVAVFPLVAAVPGSSLGAFAGSLADQRTTLIAAFDLLLTGS